jgi:hypothetical protein
VATDYPYIRAWGRMMGSYRYYVEGQLQLARQEKAPQNATYRGEEGWHTWDDFKGSAVTRLQIEDLVKEMTDA